MNAAVMSASKFYLISSDRKLSEVNGKLFNCLNKGNEEAFRVFNGKFTGLSRITD